MVLMSGDTCISLFLCQPPFPTWRDLSDQLPNFAWAGFQPGGYPSIIGERRRLRLFTHEIDSEIIMDDAVLLASNGEIASLAGTRYAWPYKPPETIRV